MSKQIQVDDRLRLVENYKFEVPVTQQYFPEGLTNRHVIYAASTPSNGRVTIRVAGKVYAPDGSFWETPHFRVPESVVERMVLAPELEGISIVEGKVHS